MIKKERLISISELLTPRSLLFLRLVILNPQIKEDLYLNGDDITKTVILTDVRIHFKNSFYRSLVISILLTTNGQ